MLYDTITKETGGLGKSDHAKVKSAYSSHKNSILKTGAAAKIEKGDGSPAMSVTLGNDNGSTNLKNFYGRFIKKGSKTIPGSGFSEEESVSLSYSQAPNLSALDAPNEDENAPGLLGSTIAASGLGPNVNVYPIDDIKARVMVTPTYNGSDTILDPYHANDGSKSPSETSLEHATPTSMPPGTPGNSSDI